jgi:hypothetical protein
MPSSCGRFRHVWPYGAPIATRFLIMLSPDAIYVFFLAPAKVYVELVNSIITWLRASEWQPRTNDGNMLHGRDTVDLSYNWSALVPEPLHQQPWGKILPSLGIMPSKLG